MGVVFGLPQAVFGLLAVVCGISIIAWALYNSLVERRTEYSGGFLTFGLGPILALFGGLWLREAFAKTRSPERDGERPNNALERTRDR